MELKITTIILLVLALATGLAVGWIVWGKKPMVHTMSMSSMMHDMNGGLEGKTGDDFDRAFLDEMIVHHKGAVDMAELVLAKSKRPELLKLAQDIISAQTIEIGTMKTWRAEWFK